MWKRRKETQFTGWQRVKPEAGITLSVRCRDLPRQVQSNCLRSSFSVQKTSCLHVWAENKKRNSRLMITAANSAAATTMWASVLFLIPVEAKMLKKSWKRKVRENRFFTEFSVWVQFNVHWATNGLVPCFHQLLIWGKAPLSSYYFSSSFTVFFIVFHHSSAAQYQSVTSFSS